MGIIEGIATNNKVIINERGNQLSQNDRVMRVYGVPSISKIHPSHRAIDSRPLYNYFFLPSRNTTMTLVCGGGGNIMKEGMGS
jgi:hypothetical protein